MDCQLDSSAACEVEKVPLYLICYLPLVGKEDVEDLGYRCPPGIPLFLFYKNHQASPWVTFYLISR
jgi:hypothetical protein